jgi:hypothetical protein
MVWFLNYFGERKKDCPICHNREKWILNINLQSRHNKNPFPVKKYHIAIGITGNGIEKSLS